LSDSFGRRKNETDRNEGYEGDGIDEDEASSNPDHAVLPLPVPSIDSMISPSDAAIRLGAKLVDRLLAGLHESIRYFCRIEPARPYGLILVRDNAFESVHYAS
jgi:hypothetical protein